MSVIVPDAWMPKVAMRKIIVHWTAGGYSANEVDRAAYHILIEESGKLVRGTHSIADNVSTADGVYAAHTFQANTGSIGVSMCCMHNCVQKPFAAGKFPLTERQWNTMLRVVAQLCRRYQIDPTPTTVLGHGEVEKNLGIKQKSKWDPMVLPWESDLGGSNVGDRLRHAVRDLMEPPPRVTVVVQGTPIGEDDAFMQDGRVYVAADAVKRILKWTIKADEDDAEVQVSASRKIRVPATTFAGRSFVSGVELAEELARPITWDADTRTVTIT